MSEQIPAPAPTVVVLGDVMVDTYARLQSPLVRNTDNPSRITRSLGGQATNVARWLATGYRSVHLIAAVGEDQAADWVRGQLEDLPTTLFTVPGSTGECIVVSEPDGSRTMLPASAANARLPRDRVLGTVATLVANGSIHLHISGYLLMHDEDLVHDVVAVCRERGMSTSMDCAAVEDPGSWATSETPRAPHVQLLLGSVPELSWLVDVPAPQRNWHDHDATLVADARRFADALRTRREGGEGSEGNEGNACTVIKLGSAGSLLVSQDIEHVPPPKVDVVDTTGAGDAFTAGFLAAFVRGASERAAAEQATTLAGRALTQVGSGPPTTEGRTTSNGQ